MMFSRFFKRRPSDVAANALYLTLVEQARLPVFYAEHGVPDTLEGRYDMIILHAHLVMRRLGQVGPDPAAAAKNLSQQLFDFMFADMDQNLREMGVSDLAVGKRVQRMAEAFFGRVAAYDQALDSGDDAALAAALDRNLYQKGHPSPDNLAAMVAYMHVQVGHLAGLADADLLAGKVGFAAAGGGAA